MASLDIYFRPYDTWTEATTSRRETGRFRVGYSKLLDDLETELTHLKAKDITIATGHRRDDIRLDGWPRANARVPHHPGVILYFQSSAGSLHFACDTYTDWQSNLRAISLTLESLRAISRHGATKGGQQYRGFQALPPAPAGTNPNADPVRNAAESLLRFGGYEVTDAKMADVIRDPDVRRRAYGAAVMKTHPDHGGTADKFMAVRTAYSILQGGQG